MGNAKNRYIISGGPGAGKSTLLQALIEKGYQGFEEISRLVIKEQHQIGGDKLPWKNLSAFAEVCYNRMSRQLSDCKNKNLCFFDRGLPDVIAYVKRGGLQVPEKYFSRCKEYNSIVFVAPPWQDIFINDKERPESFKDAIEIYQHIKHTYSELGFDIVELPKASVSERILFIQSYLPSDKDSETA